MAGIDILFSIVDVGIFFLKWFWWVIVLGYIGIMKMKWKNWPIDVVIIEKRKENLIKTNDRAGKYVDAYTGITGYRLQKAGDTIPVINYDWVLHNVFKPTNMLEKFINLLRGDQGTLFLFRYGSKQYKPIKLNKNGNINIVYKPIKDTNGEEVLIQIYEQFDPRKKLGMIDFEVVDWDNMNFMVQEQRASAERRSKKAQWIKEIAVPLAIMAVTAIICIIMIKFGYDYAINIKGSSPPPQVTPNPKPGLESITDVIPGI